MMVSRLVETVMIDVDDFADSFLTCGTCFSGYDTQERAAKLLPCSHTLCRSCLERILETQMQSNTIHCPICRENINVPAGGAASFPPAFIVNQLLDLISTQRRDVVPKCRLHSNQELLFCETCDVVFCTECRGRSHTVPNDSMDVANLEAQCSQPTDQMPLIVGSPSANSALNHNVISFNVAIKRCTEIMLYKMHLCVQELNGAQDAVSAELDRLSLNKDVCIESISSKFSEIIALVERRQAELLDTVRRLADDKHRALTDQLSLIESEREAICRECNRLKGILDVRSISKAISYLNDKLDKINSLTEPRENAFLRYQDCPTDSTARVGIRRIKSGVRITGTTASDHTNADQQSPPHGVAALVVGPISATRSGTSHVSSTGSNLLDVARCLASFGAISISTTYPALCTVRLPSYLVTYLTTKAIIQTVDYHGRPQLTGGTDPIEVTLSDADNQSSPIELIDMNDGTYEMLLRPLTAGPHRLSVQILSRPIRGSPFQLHVRRAQQRSWCFSESPDGRGLIQPFAVAYGPYPQDEPDCDASTSSHFIYLLDTGNSRLLVISPDTGCLHATLVGSALAGQAATGIAWSPEGLWIVNWRAKRVFLLDPRTDQVTGSIHSSQFIEPTSACRCPLTGRLFVADNGAGCVFLCDPVTGQTQPFVGAGAPQSMDNMDSSICAMSTSPPSSPNVLESCGRSSIRSLNFPNPELRSFRRITGVCATNNGELVMSSGSTIRVFSSTGVLLNSLVPPAAPKINKIASVCRVTTLRMPTESGEHSPSGSTLTLNTNRMSMASTGPDGTSISSVSASPFTFSARGQFGGVFVAQPPFSNVEPSDSFGTCLLASYSDRRRSGVVVWPQYSWITSSSNTRSSNWCRSVCCLYSCLPESTTLEGIPCDLNQSSIALDTYFPPYLIEAEPGLRRLAGLIAFSDSRHLAVVDQGAQSLCRLRYV